MKRKIILSALLATGLAFLLFSFVSVQKTELPQSKTDTIPDICKTISSAQLQAYMHTSKNKTVRASIYPIKKTAAVQRNDFDALIILDENNKSVKEKVSAASFEKQAGYYLDFLKKNKISMDNVPYHYTVVLNVGALKKNTPLCICIDPVTGKIRPCSNTLQDVQVLPIDSAGKCPPDCPTSAFISGWDRVMQTAIQKRK